jgi:hypothetical protein
VKCTPHKFWLIERYGINSALQKRSFSKVLALLSSRVVYAVTSITNNIKHKGYRTFANTEFKGLKPLVKQRLSKFKGLKPLVKQRLSKFKGLKPLVKQRLSKFKGLKPLVKQRLSKFKGLKPLVKQRLSKFKGLKPLVKQRLSNKGFQPLAHKSSLLRKS